MNKHADTSPEWVARPERSNVATIRLIVWIALHLGRPVARAVLLPITIYFVTFSPRATRAASRQYLARVLGRKPGLLDVYRHYHAFSSVVLDRVFLLSDRFDAVQVRMHNLEAVHEAMAGGQGCILLGAHVGSFEVIRALGRQQLAAPANLVMYEENARKLNTVLNAINPELAQRVIALGKPDAMLRVRDALRRGEFVGMLGDRVVEGEGAAVCEFLGESARFPTGPLRMAALMRAPVLVMAGLYLGRNRYEVYFDRLPESAFGERSSDAAIQGAVQAYATRIEHYCRKAPYNWFNFYDFWARVSSLILACGLVFAAGANVAVAAESPAAGAVRSEAAWGLPQLMQGMAQVKSERRRFTEKKYLKVLTTPLDSSGVLVYRAPGHLEKRTLSPRKESMVLDQGVIEIVNESRHMRHTLMASQYPAVAAFVESMRATLAGDVNALTRYYDVKVQGAASGWRLRLVPLDADARNMVREIRIQGRDSRITTIEIIEAGGDRTVMAVGDEISADGNSR